LKGFGIVSKLLSQLEGMFFWWYSTKFMFTSIVYIEYLKWSPHRLEIRTCSKMLKMSFLFMSYKSDWM
jgi:hypothetical protein